MKKLAILLFFFALSGCAVAMSASRSTSKGDPAIIQPGADRMVIESTLGSPDMTATLDGGKVKSVYKIDPNAHSEGARNAAVVGHAAADILTLGLWEVVGTPLELAAQDKLTNYIVIYNAKGKVESVEVIK